jgi:hypothetical protein
MKIERNVSILAFLLQNLAVPSRNPIPARVDSRHPRQGLPVLCGKRESRTLLSVGDFCYPILNARSRVSTPL